MLYQLSYTPSLGGEVDAAKSVRKCPPALNSRARAAKSNPAPPPATGLRSLLLFKRGMHEVARTSPGEFIRQVRAETAKVVWPTRKETVTTAIMVLIMTTLLAVFFFGVDSLFSAIVKFLLGTLS